METRPFSLQVAKVNVITNNPYETKFWGRVALDINNGDGVYYPLPDRFIWLKMSSGDNWPAIERLFRRKYLPKYYFNLGNEVEMAWRVLAYKDVISRGDTLENGYEIPELSKVFTGEEELTNPLSWKAGQRRLLGMRAHLRLDFETVDLFRTLHSKKIARHHASMSKQASMEVRRLFNNEV